VIEPLLPTDVIGKVEWTTFGLTDGIFGDCWSMRRANVPSLLPLNTGRLLSSGVGLALAGLTLTMPNLSCGLLLYRTKAAEFSALSIAADL
jgi:hypothetical protein